MTRMLRILFVGLSLGLAAPAFGTVASTTCRNDATASGSTRAFTFTFRADADSWVTVYLGGVLQATGYTVARNANQTSSPGGTVTFTSATPANGTAVRIQRVTPQTQLTALTAGGTYSAATINAALDRLAMATQDLQCQVTDVGDGLVGPQGPPGPVGSVATAADATISGNATIGGTLAVTGSVTGTVAFTGKPTAAATVGADGATTLATKGYVDAADLPSLISLSPCSWSTVITSATNWTVPGGGSIPESYCWGYGDAGAKLVVVNFITQAPGSSPGTSMGTLNSGYRPSTTAYFVGWDQTAGSAVLVSASSAGVLTVTPSPVISHEYVVNLVLRVH